MVSVSIYHKCTVNWQFHMFTYVLIPSQVQCNNVKNICSSQIMSKTYTTVFGSSTNTSWTSNLGLIGSHSLILNLTVLFSNKSKLNTSVTRVRLSYISASNDDPPHFTESGKTTYWVWPTGIFLFRLEHVVIYIILMNTLLQLCSINSISVPNFMFRPHLLQVN